MLKTWCVILSLILGVPSLGRAMPDFVQETPACGELTGQSFEKIVDDFLKEWSGEIGFCAFRKVTALNEMIAQDMSTNPRRYADRMNFLVSQKNRNQEAINHLLISFQETWFNTNIDSILLREDGRSGLWSRWLTIGAAGSAMALLAVPLTKKYSSKPLRLFKTGLKHFLQKRAITFGSTSISSQLDRFTHDRPKKAPETFVAPPLYFGGDDEVLDERTYKIFLNEMQEDVVAATSGVLGGWFLGHGASVVIRDNLAKTWSDTALKRYAWTSTKPAVFASPGMITGFAVTIVATNMISDFTSDILFNKRFREIRLKIHDEIGQLSTALQAGREFQIFSKAEKLKNDLTLQNFILSRELVEDLGALSESASHDLLNSFKLCVEPRDRLLERAKVRFYKNVNKLISQRARNLKAALLLSQDVQGVLLARPHELTKTFAATNDKLMMRATWLLDSNVTASDLWQDLSHAVKDQPVDCLNLSDGMPL